MDTAAQQVARRGGDFHEVAGAGVGDTQHDAEASPGRRPRVGERGGESARRPGAAPVSVLLGQLLVQFVEEQLPVVDLAGPVGGSRHQVGGDRTGHQLEEADQR